jgi:coproporphyrinogen III oxidase-like Fe-S oxidoreductase
MDALIGRLARRIFRDAMRFTAPPQAVPLPAPAPGRHYLLYLHVPYCVTLCPFCSFHRIRFEREDADSYFDCLREDIRRATAAGFRFDEVYVGGGTPTVLPDELFETLRLVRNLHPVDSVSVETNPDDLARDKVLALRDAGVDRLSVGVQSFDDTLLKEMQRYEKYGSGADIRRRLERARGSFPTLNVDMIFNFPHQDEGSIRRDLDILVDDLGADQVSWYPLMPAEGTKQSIRRHLGDLGYAREREMYELIAERMLSAGYRRNSAWCFSRSGGMADEYIADREEYLGLGSGAFSYLGGTLYSSTFSIPRYKARIGDGESGIERYRALSDREQKRYYLLMQLFGGSLDLAATEERFDGRFRRSLLREIALFETLGAVRESDEQLVLTEYGCYVWVVLMREFFAALNNLRDEMRAVSGARAPKPA